MFNFLKRKNTTLLPWVGKETIYNYIKINLDSEGKLPTECEDLPDSAEFYEDKPLRWVSGAMDSVMSHHSGSSDEEDKVLMISKLLRQQIAKQSNFTRRETYIAFMDDDILGFVDPLLEHLRKQSDLNIRVLYDEAKWFAKEGVHRGVVKMGIALLGLFNCEQDEELLMTLGKHEEFTLFVSVAIVNGFTNSNQKLFELAKCVQGWGKIHLVERLEAETDEIKDWLLRQGCNNSIMPEYLAFTCSVKGNLSDALGSQSIDEELYKGAGIIIAALIAGGPAEDIDDYDASMLVITNFLRHSFSHCNTLSNLLVVTNIKGFLEQEGEIWNKRLVASWNNKTRENCLEECKKIIFQDRWDDLIWSEIGSEDNYKKYCATQAARILGIDTWQQLYAELQTKPLDSGLYYELMRTDNKERIKKLVAFAEEYLPLKDIATGPGTELGLGPDFKAHGCLDFILQDLDGYEGVGGKLILTGLKSTVIRNRNMAIKVLEVWNKSSWPEETIDMLNELLESEQDSNVKKRIEDILARTKEGAI
jgi:hypothetical protein